MPLTPSTTDLFLKVGVPGTATTLAAPGYTIGNASINVGSTSNWSTDTPVIFAIDNAQVVNGVATRIAGSYCEFFGIVASATSIGNLLLKYGSAQNYVAGSLTRVYIPVTGSRENMLIDGLNQDHNGRGNHKDLTGANQHTVLGLTDVASAVNDVRATNSIAGQAPLVAAEGSDANINLLMQGKGSGSVISALALKQGDILNGQIVPSITTNNLIVTLKTLDGNTPSANNPVFVRIGNTLRSVTAALSVTLNAGTNWFGKGASYFATNESDYFVYLVWNTNTSAVQLAISSDPNMRIYSDFSTTNTNWNYFGGTGTAPASTDVAENIGRFNAILSATAAFNWSLPATQIILNRPTYETRIFSITNTGSAGGTIWWQQKGSKKEAWGQTAVKTNAANTSSNFVVTFPVGFFSAIGTMVTTVMTASGSITGNEVIGVGIDVTGVTLGFANTTASPGIGGVGSFTVIGT